MVRGLGREDSGWLGEVCEEDFVSVSWNLLGYHVEDGRQLRPFPGKVFCHS